MQDTNVHYSLRLITNSHYTMLHPDQGQNSFQDFALHSLDPSGSHSDQGSIFPGIQQDSVEENDIGTFRPAPSTEFRGSTCCESFVAGDTIFAEKSPGGVETHSKTPTRGVQGQGLKYILSHDKGPYTKTIHFLRGEDPEIIPHNPLSEHTAP